MHEKNIYHRDLKPQNILVKSEGPQYEVCVADFGYAVRSSNTKELTVKCGTPSYMDPEVLNGTAFTEKSDIFSLGSILFNLVTQKILFPGYNIKDVLNDNRYIDPIPRVRNTTRDLNISSKCRLLLY